MSATNRLVKSLPSEDYPTPQWAVHRLLDQLDRIGFLSTLTPDRQEWLEPAWGAGHLVKAVQNWNGGYLSDRINWHTGGEDYFARPTLIDRPYYVAISNTPFSLTQPFIEKMLVEAHHVIILQRINWVANDFCIDRPPDVMLLPDRPVFVHTVGTDFGPVRIPFDAPTPPYAQLNKRGKPIRVAGSDASEYAWLHWSNDEVVPPREGSFIVLPRTSLKERQADDGRFTHV